MRQPRGCVPRELFWFPPSCGICEAVTGDAPVFEFYESWIAHLSGARHKKTMQYLSAAERHADELVLRIENDKVRRYWDERRGVLWRPPYCAAVTRHQVKELLTFGRKRRGKKRGRHVWHPPVAAHFFTGGRLPKHIEDLASEIIEYAKDPPRPPPPDTRVLFESLVQRVEERCYDDY